MIRLALHPICNMPETVLFLKPDGCSPWFMSYTVNRKHHLVGTVTAEYVHRALIQFKRCGYTALMSRL